MYEAKRGIDFMHGTIWNNLGMLQTCSRDRIEHRPRHRTLRGTWDEPAYPWYGPTPPTVGSQLLIIDVYNIFVVLLLNGKTVLNTWKSEQRLSLRVIATFLSLGVGGSSATFAGKLDARWFHSQR